MASSPYPMWSVVPGAFLSLIIVCGNGLVVYLIITRIRLHSATNWIVLSLSIADFFLGAGYLPGRILLTGTSPVVYCVLSFLIAASALNLSLLTVDGYVVFFSVRILLSLWDHYYGISTVHWTWWSKGEDHHIWACISVVLHCELGH